MHLRNGKSMARASSTYSQSSSQTQPLQTSAPSGDLNVSTVGTKGVSQVYHLSFDDNKVLKIINWIC